MSFENDIRSFDETFEAWKQKHPGQNFSDFSTARILYGIKKGRAHSSIGPKLANGKDWWESGVSSYQNITQHHYIRPHEKIVEYGCGSLRVGVHFIKKQQVGCYFGLDVRREFIKYGEDILGELALKKQVQVGTINKNMNEAVVFGADVIFSANVIMHVHPSEMEAIHANFKSLAHSHASVVISHVLVSDQPVRYKRSGWAWPLSYYDQMMQPFIRIAATKLQAFSANDINMTGYLLSYQKPVGE